MSASITGCGGEVLEIVKEDIVFKLGGFETVLGGFGSYRIKVYERILADGQKVAIKRISLSDVSNYGDENYAKESREWVAMKDLKHDNVLKLHSFHNIEDFMYLVLERCDGTLNDYFNALNPEWSGNKYDGPVPEDADALYQMADGLRYIHETNLVHRDIEPKNILISSSSSTYVLLKISDFSVCKATNRSGSYSVGNSIMHKINHITTAPELLKAAAENMKAKANQMSDVFSLGCVFFSYLTKGKHLFMSDEDKSLYDIPKNILVDNYYLDLEGRLNYDQKDFAKDIIQDMVKHNPHERKPIGYVKEEIFKRRDLVKKLLVGVTKSESDKKLGEGAFGLVYEKVIDGNKFAIKRLRLNNNGTDDQTKSINREKMMKQFDHDNVLKLFSSVSDSNYIYFKLEWCDASLREYCNAHRPYWTLLEKEDRKYEGPVPSDANGLFQMANGLLHIHTKKFVHRDIKPENILISVSPNGQAVLKISDFGLGKPTNEDGNFSDSKCGRYKPFFTAPELLQSNNSEMTNYLSDVFSLGCVFFIFLTQGKHPFYEDGCTTRFDIAIPFNISTGNYKLQGRLNSNQNFAENIIDKMVQRTTYSEDKNERGPKTFRAKLEDVVEELKNHCQLAL